MTARVLVVDDSAVVRRLVATLLDEEPDLVVVGKARNGQHALQRVAELRPDVVVMDVEMPVMDGIEAVRIMRERFPRTPVVMFSTFTERGSRSSMDALVAGAAGYVSKQSSGGDGLKGIVKETLAPKLREVVPHLAQRGNAPADSAPPPSPSPAPATAPRPSMEVRPVPAPPAPPLPSTRPGRTPAFPVSGNTSASPDLDEPSHGSLGHESEARSWRSGERPSLVDDAPVVRIEAGPRPRRKVSGTLNALVIGCSTGGPNALADVIPRLPGDLGVPVLIVQHMPPRFTRLLADRLDGLSELTVREAEAGDEVVANKVLLAPGGYHMRVRRQNGRVLVTLDREPPVNSCRPAVDPLFWSVGEVYGGNVLGVILTGMGQDGLDGAQVLSAKGAPILAQDEASSVVWGMPRAVAQAGIADDILPLDQIAPAIVRRFRKAGAVKRTG